MNLADSGVAETHRTRNLGEFLILGVVRPDDRLLLFVQTVHDQEFQFIKHFLITYLVCRIDGARISDLFAGTQALFLEMFGGMVELHELGRIQDTSENRLEAIASLGIPAEIDYRLLVARRHPEGLFEFHPSRFDLVVCLPTSPGASIHFAQSIENTASDPDVGISLETSQTLPVLIGR